MAYRGLSDQVRAVAKAKYVSPAVGAGKVQFSIRVRDLLGDLEAIGFPRGHTPQVCSALQTAKFLHENGLEIESVDGPPKKQSPTVVVRYRVAKQKENGEPDSVEAGMMRPNHPEESPEEWAHRVTGRISGILKDEIAEFGGTEAFIRWVRGYDEENTA